MMLDQLQTELQKISDWQHEYMGRQEMQKVVLRWAVRNKDAMIRVGLASSLIAAMETELATHNAARPNTARSAT